MTRDDGASVTATIQGADSPPRAALPWSALVSCGVVRYRAVSRIVVRCRAVSCSSVMCSMWEGAKAPYLISGVTRECYRVSRRCSGSVWCSRNVGGEFLALRVPGWDGRGRKGSVPLSNACISWRRVALASYPMCFSRKVALRMRESEGGEKREMERYVIFVNA